MIHYPYYIRNAQFPLYPYLINGTPFKNVYLFDSLLKWAGYSLLKKRSKLN